MCGFLYLVGVVRCVLSKLSSSKKLHGFMSQSLLTVVFSTSFLLLFFFFWNFPKLNSFWVTWVNVKFPQIDWMRKGFHSKSEQRWTRQRILTTRRIKEHLSHRIHFIPASGVVVDQRHPFPSHQEAGQCDDVHWKTNTSNIEERFSACFLCF